MCEPKFDRESENGSGECNLCEKGVLLFNQALIHARVRHMDTHMEDKLSGIVTVTGKLSENMPLQVVNLQFASSVV